MPSNAALIDNGGGLIYDDVLDITWAQGDNTSRTWDSANTWVSGLVLAGAGDWRLPYASVAAGAGPFTGSPIDCSTATELACRDNELGYMFYHNLSGTSGSSILTSGDLDLALFTTLQAGLYWTTEFNSFNAWYTSFGSGTNSLQGKNNIGIAWAVHAGNVGASTVPVPDAVWLFASGLLGMTGIARRKKTA